jgi:hypothetical protein
MSVNLVEAQGHATQAIGQSLILRVDSECIATKLDAINERHLI